MGKKIGSFWVSNTQLGEGNFSVVHLGKHEKTGQEVAVKIIKNRSVAAENAAKQMMREIAVMQTLRHPNVVCLHETLQTSNNIYMVLEMVKGTELFTIVKQHPYGMPEDLVRKYYHDVIAGVHYVHSQSLAHRDLKPENILITNDGHVKIADFGLSNIQATTQSGRVPDMMALKTLCGTLHYVAPEVLEKGGYNGFQADVWSCGVILYVCLVGTLPFNDTTSKLIMDKILACKPTLPPHLSPLAAEIIGRILVKCPTGRYTIPDIISHPWFVVGFDPSKLSQGSRD